MLPYLIKYLQFHAVLHLALLALRQYRVAGSGPKELISQPINELLSKHLWPDMGLHDVPVKRVPQNEMAVGIFSRFVSMENVPRKLNVNLHVHYAFVVS